MNFVFGAISMLLVCLLSCTGISFLGIFFASGPGGGITWARSCMVFAFLSVVCFCILAAMSGHGSGTI